LEKDCCFFGRILEKFFVHWRNLGKENLLEEFEGRKKIKFFVQKKINHCLSVLKTP
jgi:hypothetical protein